MQWMRKLQWMKINLKKADIKSAFFKETISILISPVFNLLKYLSAYK